MFQQLALTKCRRWLPLPLHIVRLVAPLPLVVISLLVAILADAQPPDAASRERPNIVLIITDDQGWGDLSVHGNTNLSTPHIDSLARDGAAFDRFYVSPVCAPTRASLLTGRYHPRTGVAGVTRGAERMNLNEVTLADVFKASGYATGAFGKWHNGSQYPYHPNGRGFDEFYGFCCGHWSNYFDTLLEHNGEEVRGKGFIIDDLTEKAIEFIGSNRQQPFLCYVAYNTPHSPFQVPDAYYDRMAGRPLKRFHRDKSKEEPEKTKSALAMCENIDSNVGRILAALKDHELAGNTIVLYLSDNGPNSWRYNDGMKGKKGSVDEGGVRVPLFVRWPDRVEPGTKIEQIASHIDLLPTLADVAGVATDKCKPLDGVSLRPLLEGHTEDWPERMIFSAQRNRISVRTPRYRADANSLFDMQADPGQTKNLAAKLPKVHGQLVDAVDKWRAEVFPKQAAARPYPVGHASFPLTVLPAQDCEFTGKGLAFSSRHPNASWLQGWTDAAAYPYWNIDVATAGRYQVTVMYTCAEADVGSVLELRFGDRSLRDKVAEAFDPPLIDSPDRVPRQESYEKPFRALEIGQIDLPTRRGELELRALSKPGKHVMDVRSVKLRLIEVE